MDVEQQVDDDDELDTQQEDWLLRTESLHRTRPRRIIREYRRCPEYEEFFLSDQVNETGKFGNQTQKGSGQVRWFGQELSRAPDSGIGYSQDHRVQCAGDDWEKRKSNQPMDSQLMGRKRRAGDRFAPSSYEEEVVRQTEHRWDTPRKRALFGSDEPDSTTSGSDVVETQDFGLPHDCYAMGVQSGLLIENDSPETARSPSKKLEDAVTQIQRDIAGILAEDKVQRTLLGLRNGRDLLPRQFPDIRENLVGNNIGMCLRPLCARMAGTVLRRPCSCFPTWMEMLSMSPC